MIIDIGNLVQMAGVAFGITAGSRLAEWAWKKNRTDIVDKLNAVDEKIEAKTGYQWPIEMHLVYDQAVKKIVSGIDYVANPVVFRRVERALLALVEPATREKLLTEYLDFVKGKATEIVTDKLKEIVNKEKESIAVEALGAQASISLPPEFLATRDIKADVKAAVLANKHMEEKELSTDEINAKIANTRAKLDALIAK